MADVPTIYDIVIDETRPITQADVESMGKVYSAFGMWREAEKALMALTLAVGQGKTSQEEAWRRLQPLLDGAKADAG